MSDYDEVDNAIAWAAVRHLNGVQNIDAIMFGILLTYISVLEETVKALSVESISVLKEAGERL